MIYWFLSLVAVTTAVLILKKYMRHGSMSLPVLMYHKVSANGFKDALTVQSLMLERQFHHLKKEGYTPVLLSRLTDFVLHKKPLPSKPILITFDDGYRDNYTVMYPLLKQYGITANIFLIASSITDQGNKASQPANEYLHLNDIMSMDPAIVQFGLHSYDHKNYNDLTIPQLNDDINQSKMLLTTMGVRFQPCLAFPYGAYPKRNRQKQLPFFEALTHNKIILAFRIGNRLNPLPLNNSLLIQRLNIEGDMSFEKFTRLLKKGKSLFS